MGRSKATAGAAGMLLLAACLVGVAVRATPASAVAPGPYRGAVAFRPDGVLRSAPATVHQPSFGHAVFVVGTNGLVYWSTERVGWTPLAAVPAGVVGDPAAVSWADGRIDVFVRGGDNHLWQAFTTCGGCSWSNWFQPVGVDGTLASAPIATSWSVGRLDVFVLGADGSFWQRYWDNNSWNGNWLRLGAPAPGVNDRPAASAGSIGRIDIFARGNDSKLWQSFWTGSSWTSWFHPAGTEQGTMASAASASPWGNRVTVFVRGTDGRVYQTTYDGGWAPWAAVGAPNNVIVGAPGTFSSRQSNPYVVARGSDDRAYAFYPADPLGSAVAGFVGTRNSNVTAAVYDVNTGQTFTFRPGVAEFTASTVKVDILATLLTRAQAAGRGLTSEEQSLAVPMIENSLDSAASTLWGRLGPAAVGSLERSVGMTQTAPATNGIWGKTTTTALDRIAMIAALVFPNSVLTNSSRAYVLDLMEHVTPSQAWGISGGVPAGVTIALKNGFAPSNGWQINSTGWVSGLGRNYLVAILSNGNATEAYGIDTVNGVSAIIWNALGP